MKKSDKKHPESVAYCVTSGCSNILSQQKSEFNLETPIQLRLFSPEECEMLRPLKWRIFLETEIGQIYQVLPLSELATLFPYKKSPHPQGVKGFFDVQGGMALQVLKHHSGMSDEQGRWRRYLASFNKGQTWESAQKVLAKAWQGDMKDIAPLEYEIG